MIWLKLSDSAMNIRGLTLLSLLLLAGLGSPSVFCSDTPLSTVTAITTAPYASKLPGGMVSRLGDARFLQAAPHRIEHAPEHNVLLVLGETLVKWNASNGQRILSFNSDLEGHIYDFDLSPDGSRLVSASAIMEDDGESDEIEIVLWNALTGEPVERLLSCNGQSPIIRYMPDGARFIIVAGQYFPRRMEYQYLARICDAQSGDVSSKFSLGSSLIRDVAIDPVEKIVYAGRHDGNISCYSYEEGKNLDELPQKYPVWSLDFAPERGLLLATGNNYHWGISREQARGEWNLWDVRRRELLHCETGEPIRAGAFCSEQRVIACAGRQLQLWNVKDPSKPTPLQALQDEYGNSVDMSFAVDFTSDGETLAAVDRDRVYRWDVRSGRLKASILGHTESVTALAVAPDGAILASSGNDHTLRIWDVSRGTQTQEPIYHDAALSGVAFAYDETGLISGDVEGRVQLWSLQEGTLVRQLGGFGSAIRGPVIASSRNTAYFADKNAVYRWQLDHFKTEKLWEREKGAPATTSFALAPSGEVAAVGRQRGYVQIIHIDTDRTTTDLDVAKETITAINFSQNGELLVCVSHEGTVSISDVSAGSIRWRSPPIHSAAYSAIFINDNKWIVSGHEDGSMHIWNVSTGSRLLKVTGRFGSVTCIDVMDDGRILACGGADQVILAWDSRWLKTQAEHE